jgi:UDP-2,3-diacylglucosamine hydrolase
MHGNRDFLLGQAFAKKSGCTLLADPTVIQLYQDKILLTHGDQLCTLDTQYQRFRKFVQHPLTRRIFLSLPIFIRRKIATLLRTKSSERQSMPQNKQYLEHWDVVSETVNKMLREHQCLTLIHGHTHKAGIHEFILDNQPANRIVLGDWDDTGNVLIYNNNAISFKLLT